MFTPLWSVGAPSIAFTPLDGDVETDVCVVGLGGSGLTCISELRDAGVRVVGVDASSVGAGAAGRNGGFLLGGIAAFHHDAVAAHGRERAARAYRLTLDELARIAAATPDAVRLTGSLRIAVDDEEYADCEAQHVAMTADGLPVERYDGPEGRGLLFPRDGTFNPLLRCRLLAHQATEAGATLHEQTPALAVAEHVVVTPHGRVRAGAIVIAVDGSLERLVPELHGRVRTARLQMVGTAPAREVRFPRPVYTRYGLDYWQQLDDRRIALGGFRDAGGEEEWTGSTEPSERVQTAIEHFLRTTLGVAAPITHRWAASVSYSATGLPIVEEVKPGVWVAGAYSGTGNVVGALSGRALAQLVTRGTTDLLM
jgi:glycine/D-amino acid oxidase-like deaminating enzyme